MESNLEEAYRGVKRSIDNVVGNTTFSEIEKLKILEAGNIAILLKVKELYNISG